MGGLKEQGSTAADKLYVKQYILTTLQIDSIKTTRYSFSSTILKLVWSGANEPRDLSLSFASPHVQNFGSDQELLQDLAQGGKTTFFPLSRSSGSWLFKRSNKEHLRLLLGRWHSPQVAPAAQ